MNKHRDEFSIGNEGSPYPTLTELQRLTSQEKFEFLSMQFSRALESRTFTEVFSQPRDGKVVGYALAEEEYQQAREICDLWNNFSEELNSMRSYCFYTPEQSFMDRYFHIPAVFNRLSRANEGLSLDPKTPEQFMKTELDGERRKTYDDIMRKIVA